MADLWLHPVLPFAIAAAVAWSAPRRVGMVASVAAPLAAMVQLLQLDAGAAVRFTYAGFDLDTLRVDALSLPFGWVFAIAALIAAVYGLATMDGRERTSTLAYAGAGMGVVFAGDLMTLFVLWEIKAVSSTFVILNRRDRVSSRAGMRYLFAHLVGGKLLLAGVLWHHARTGSLTFDPMTLDAASSLILAAFLLSAAVPPLHAWLADAYPTASPAGTVFLSAFTTKAAVYALARGFPGTSLLIGLGVVMVFYGLLYAMLENDIRRLLSYHIISQVGYMVAAVGIGTELAISGATAHAFAHVLYKGLLLMGMGAVLHATGRSRASELGGIARRMRGVLALYMVGAVSISSVPLFSGFVSKEIVVEAASVSELGWLVLLLKIASVGTFLSTGLKLPYATFFGRQGGGPTVGREHRVTVARIPASMYVAMGLGAIMNLAIGLRPALLYDLLPHAVDFAPYTTSKVLEKSQLLVFTVLAFWLLIDQLHAKAKVSLDVDRLYRGLPARLAAPARRPSDPAPAHTAAPSVLRERAAALLAPDRGEVIPTWILGLVILVTAIMITIVSLL